MANTVQAVANLATDHIKTMLSLSIGDLGQRAIPRTDINATQSTGSEPGAEGRERHVAVSALQSLLLVHKQILHLFSEVHNLDYQLGQQ